ncbi:right-handed parallel beta-helix repeat-containing protein [Actinomadura sp. ATCC 31491]|uniref:Right-handed parallel beta-helix repeat-containing protein n=1 Tax=Actinomadura luzonensis TaxID=2805427 RepID=A0ABT0FUN8_9ACTN|nr:right-handed parallel beta-helix repeat-containing protein [Actinomadura luzonensis]MCK2216053.1 right-handed parallel beta-helix repeat-containing protein [Actinomadura luzonensis]
MRLLSVAVMASLLPTVPAAVPAAAASAHAGTTYYVDSRSGDDSATGTSARTPWKSLDAVNAADLKPGDTVAVKRGSSFTGSLTLAAKGTPARPITVTAYGKGPLAKITGTDEDCVVVSGDHWRIGGLRASGCRWAGFRVEGRGNQLSGVQADRNIAGVQVIGSRNIVRDSVLTGNDRMSVNDVGGDNDSGAFGVLLNGDDNVVAGNTITGSFARSADYGADGAAVEVFNGDRNLIVRNVSRDNETFTELGAEKGRTAAGNVFAFNVVTSSRSRGSFLITRGPRHVVGPVMGTVAVHNSVYLPARDTVGWSCHDGCSPAILKLRNNVIVVGGEAGWEDGQGADDDANVYRGRIRFKLGPKSVVADPKFVSRADLRLRPGSPALGRGVPLGGAWFGGGRARPKDVQGRELDGTPDAGAYQSGR